MTSLAADRPSMAERARARRIDSRRYPAEWVAALAGIDEAIAANPDESPMVAVLVAFDRIGILPLAEPR